MCGRNCKIVLTIILLHFHINCSSSDGIRRLFREGTTIERTKNPMNENDVCVSYYFRVNSEINSIRNRAIFINIGTASFSAGYFLLAGPPALILLTVIPVNEYLNYQPIDAIYYTWEQKCSNNDILFHPSDQGIVP